MELRTLASNDINILNHLLQRIEYHSQCTAGTWVMYLFEAKVNKTVIRPDITYGWRSGTRPPPGNLHISTRQPWYRAIIGLDLCDALCHYDNTKLPFFVTRTLQYTSGILNMGHAAHETKVMMCLYWFYIRVNNLIGISLKNSWISFPNMTCNILSRLLLTREHVDECVSQQEWNCTAIFPWQSAMCYVTVKILTSKNSCIVLTAELKTRVRVFFCPSVLWKTSTWISTISIR